MKNQRSIGHYWVRVKKSKTKRWVIAQWLAGRPYFWQLVGQSSQYDDDDFAEIGGRIEQIAGIPHGMSIKSISLVGYDDLSNTDAYWIAELYSKV